jgi:transcriptional regulator with XRE-family HTH domain
MVQRWSGRETRALREALRMSSRAFAARLGVNERTVTNWEARRGQIYPRPEMQAALDTLLEQASDEAKQRFEQILRGELAPTDRPPAGAGRPVAEIGRVADDAVHTETQVAGEADPQPSTIESADEIMRRSRRLDRSNVDEAKLTYLERMVDTAIRENERRPPHELASYVRYMRRWIDELLDGQQHPPQRERLYVAAARLSGLLGALALDLGRWPSARAYGLEAFQLAEFLGLADLQAWTRANQSLIEYYAGNYHDALAYAQDGQRLSPSGPQSVRLALNGEARAWARLGNVQAVDEAVGRGFDLLHVLPPADGVSPSLSVDVYCSARAAANAATAYLVLQRPGPVHDYAEQALIAFDAVGLHGPQALSRLDQATALLMEKRPDVEHACTIVGEALACAANERFESVIRRASEFVALAQQQHHHPAVHDMADRVRAYSQRPVLEAGPSGS